MSEQQVKPKKYLIFDTNILFSIIDALKYDETEYEIFINDLEKYVNYSNYSICISNYIMDELQRIGNIKVLDRIFQDKRIKNSRINVFKINPLHPLIKLLQPYFKGNLDENGIREVEYADHTLIINAVDFAKKNMKDPIPIVIYSNDHEVQDVTDDLETILPREYNFTAEFITWRAGFQLLAEMLQLKKTLQLTSNLEELLKISLSKYHDSRKRTPNKDQTFTLFLNTYQNLIEFSENKILRSEILEKELRDIKRRHGESLDGLSEFLTVEEKNNENKNQLFHSIELAEKKELDKAVAELKNSEIIHYSSLLKTFHQIIHEKENQLHRYYREWNKIHSGKKIYTNNDIERLFHKKVFISLVQKQIEHFKANNLKKAYNLSMGLIPLLADVQWQNEIEGKHLEKYYIMGLYLALQKNNIEEFTELLEILQLAIEEQICQSEEISQYYTFGCLIRDLNLECNINQKFKSIIIQNIQEFYYTRHWNAVWNLLLPLWQVLDEKEKTNLIEILEFTYWITLNPPERLKTLWNEINEVENIVKGKNLGTSLLDREQEQIKKGIVPDFLKGEHLVIDTTMIGRAHIIIHVKSKNSRFGVQIKPADDLNLKKAQTIEFTDESISKFIKGLKQDEKEHFMSGIIELNKDPNLNIKLRKNNLVNFRL
jgi:hypothetical protein